jgi:hypothetical protein
MEKNIDFNNVKIYFKVDYRDKDDIKKCKARLCPKYKKWYIIHNYENNNAYGCFGDLREITKYNAYLDFIKHNYYKSSDHEIDEIYIKYDKLLRKYRRENFKE